MALFFNQAKFFSVQLRCTGMLRQPVTLNTPQIRHFRTTQVLNKKKEDLYGKQDFD